MAFQQRMMQTLEMRGELDRTVEYLPSDADLRERRNRNEGLTRPELAVLLAYGKLSLYSDLLASEVPDDPYLADELMTYFPPALRARFPQAIATHRLRREIIATGLANALINQGGPTCLARISDQTGADVAAIARAFVAVRDIYGLPRINAAIDALDNKVDGEVQLGLYRAIQDSDDRPDHLVPALCQPFRGHRQRGGALRQGGRLCRWRARYQPAGDLAGGPRPPHCGTGAAGRDRGAGRRDRRAAGAGGGLRHRAAGGAHGRALDEAAPTFFAVGRYFAIDDIVTAAKAISAPDYYDRLALDRALGQLETFIRQ